MKQIVDKLNKIAKKIDESVEIPQTDLIIDSLDAITKAYGGTPNDSNLIVDKLEDIYNNVSPAVSGNIEITENGENINVAPYATATVNVSGGGGDFTTAQVTVISDTLVKAVTGFEAYEVEGYAGIAFYDTTASGTNVVIVPLYKGTAIWHINPQYAGNITVSGNIMKDSVALIITGDGTITYAS